MISIIGYKIFKTISNLGLTLTLIIGLILFYEGIPFLNWWPVNQAPLVGWFIQGEIDRRLDYAIEKATNKERQAWQKSLEEAKQKRDNIIKDKNKQIEEIISNNITKENNIKIQQELDNVLLESTIDKENESDKDTNNILNSIIPDSVYKTIK
jgi:hypothetical protein